MKIIIITSAIIIFIIGCDGGLAPTGNDIAKKTGFGGIVSFIGEWDSLITQTNIVLFKEPLLSDADFKISNLKYLSTPIPFGVNDYNFNTLDSITFGNVQEGEYAYLAVVQTKKKDISLERKDWFVVGVYKSDEIGLNPGEIVVRKNKFEFNVDIVCDFNNPPPQPPGGE